MGECPGTFFTSPYQSKFFNAFKGESFMCVENDELYLQGTRDSKPERREHSYMLFEFVKCHKDLLEEGDEPCAEMSDINDWLATKAAHLRILNQRVDMRKKNQISENEIWMPVVQFKPGVFTDQGFRYRENILPKEKSILPWVGNDLKKFYDVTFYSSDAILVQDDFPIIAEMYFRINGDSIIYTQVDYGLLSFLGDVGGVESLVYQILFFIFGGFLQFN